MVLCAAINCNNDSRRVKGIGYYPIIKREEKLQKIWIHNLRRKNYIVTKNSAVCGVHFSEEMFVRDMFAELMPCNSRRGKKLINDAIPTIFNFSQLSKPKPVRRRLETEQRIAKKARKEVIHNIISEYDIPIDGNEFEEESFAPIIEPTASTITSTTESSMQTDTVIFPTKYPRLTRKQNRGTQTTVTTVKDASTQANEQREESSFCNCRCICNVSDVEPIHPLKMSTPTKKYTNVNTSLSSEANLSVLDNTFISTHDSDYIPNESLSTTNSSSSSSIETSTQFDTTQPPQTDTKYIIFESCLSQLFIKCSKQNCCGMISHHTKRTLGTLLAVEMTCNNGHSSVWYSQPYLSKMPAGNLLTAAALLFSGSSYTQINNFAKTLHLNFFTEKTYCKIQDVHLFPTINNAWILEQAAVIARLEGQQVWLCGDGRCDSPGFCAKYCNYTMMDINSGKVVAYNLVQVSEVGSSTNMEKLGFLRCLTEVKEALDVKVLATDRHLQISKAMKDETTIQHQFDMWHFAKSFGKKLGQAAKRKDCNALSSWARSIANHVWWSAATCLQDEVLLKEKFISIVHHVSNIHEWQSADKYHRCAHEPMNPEYIRSKQWIKPGSPSHKALQDVIFNTRLLNQLKKLTLFCHTGELEVFHSLLLKYCPKRQHFSYKGMHARQQLAILDHNHNTDRPQAETNGKKRYDLVFTKMTKQWVAKPIKEKKSYHYLDNMLDTLVTNKKNNTTLPSVVVPLLPPNIATKEKPDKQEAIKMHNSRMGKDF